MGQKQTSGRILRGNAGVRSMRCLSCKSVNLAGARFLQTLAVLGREFVLSLARAVAGKSEPELERLIGVPFFMEETVQALFDEGALEQRKGKVHAQRYRHPSTVTGLVLAGTDIYYPPFGYWIASWIAAPGVDPATIAPYDKAGIDPKSWEAMRSFPSSFVTVHYWNFYALLSESPSISSEWS